MVLLEIPLITTERDLFVGCVRDDVTIQRDVCITQLRFHLRFQQLIQLNLGVLHAMQVSYPFGVNERDVLPLTIVYPQDEVGIEIVRLEEANTLPTLVAQEIKLLPCQLIVLMLLVIPADIPNESLFTSIQGHRRNLNQPLVLFHFKHAFCELFFYQHHLPVVFVSAEVGQGVVLVHTKVFFESFYCHVATLVDIQAITGGNKGGNKVDFSVLYPFLRYF